MATPEGPSMAAEAKRNDSVTNVGQLFWAPIGGRNFNSQMR
jgi:hypothetical protein